MDKEVEKLGPDLDRIGLFKEMSYLEHVPQKIEFTDAWKKGKQMMTNCTKSKNGTQDGYFDKSFPRVFEGEAYMDVIRLRRLHRLREAKKTQDKKFIYSNPPKKPCGSGSNYGTFDDYAGKVEYFSSHPREAEPSEPPAKNFFVNPGKKGTGYGYANLTIGKTPPYFLEEDYEELKKTPQTPKRPEPRPFEPYRAGLFQQEFFDPNPYKIDWELPSPPPRTEPEESIEAEIFLPSSPAKKQTPKRPEPRPFEPYRAGLFQQEFFDPNPYKIDWELPSPPPRTEPEESIEAEIFLPSSPAKKDGGMKAGCLNKFPDYESDPFPKPYMETRGVEHHVDTENKIFGPVPKLRPYPIKSIITKNVERKVTPKNFITTKGVVYCKK
ncbi:UPF0602 protein C4orf47 homolog [Nephila pilipes]|uniref:Cilia-and flagella-associated protein 96 n=1 Tax=Nephila pilipes TaxID=299642 RepID=A0A8X6TTV1_NEPPI|nr:UPF0602 protein C4orf47 homolog [Nephila pilipes]